MRPALHLCALLLALPQVLLCAVFLLLGHVTGGGTLGSLFTRLLDTVFFLFSWGGLLTILAFVALIVAGFSARWRPFAAGIVAVLVLASAAMLIVNVGVSDVLIFLPGLISLGVSVWLVSDFRTSRFEPRTS